MRKKSNFAGAEKIGYGYKKGKPFGAETDSRPKRGWPRLTNDTVRAEAARRKQRDRAIEIFFSRPLFLQLYKMALKKKSTWGKKWKEIN